MIDGRDHTRKLVDIGIEGTLPGGGRTLLIPERPLSLVKRLGAGEHTFHVEVEQNGDARALIDRIKKRGCKAGMSVQPATNSSDATGSSQAMSFAAGNEPSSL